MHVGIVGPIATENIQHLLNTTGSNLPRGYVGAPLMATLIEELLRRGHRVSAFTTSEGVPVSRTRWISAGNDRFTITYVGLRPRAFRINSGYVGRAADFFNIERVALAAAIRQSAPDIAHAHWCYEFGLAAIASGIPHVVTCHDVPAQVLKMMPNPYRAIRYLMGRRCLKSAKTVTAVSPYTKEAVQSQCRTQVEIIPNPLPRILSERRNHINSDTGNVRRIVMVLNGWGTRKNAQPALQAFNQLRKEASRPVELHLFGRDFGPGELAEQWCNKNEIVGGVVFHGFTPHSELLKHLQSMHVMIHPALEESCPMGIAEAMSLGLPVVGGRESGGTSWVIGDGGILTDVSSPDSIAAATERLMEDTHLWRLCSDSARQRSQSTFNTQAVTKQYEDVYARVLNPALG